MSAVTENDLKELKDLITFNFSQVNQRLENIEKEIGETKQDIKTIKQEIQEVKIEQGKLTGKFEGIKPAVDQVYKLAYADRSSTILNYFNANRKNLNETPIYVLIASYAFILADSTNQNNVLLTWGSTAYTNAEAKFNNDINLYNGKVMKINDTQVLTNRQPNITDSVGGDEQIKINAILATLRTHGLIG